MSELIETKTNNNDIETTEIGAMSFSLPTKRENRIKTLSFGQIKKPTSKNKSKFKYHELPGNISLDEMAQIVETDSTLSICLGFIVRMATQFGYFIEKTGKKSDAKNRKKLELFMNHGWIDNLQGSLEQFVQDYEYFGQGALIAEPPTLETSSVSYESLEGLKTRPKVARMRHVSRLDIRQIKARQDKVERAGIDVVIENADDILYPMFEYKNENILRYYRSFGDQRRINRYTGEESQNVPWSEIAYEIMVMTRKKPISPFVGWPGWICSYNQVGSNRGVEKYIRNVVEKNCVPDLLVWIKGADVGNESAVQRKIENRFDDTKNLNMSEGPGARVVVMTIPAPKTPTGKQVELEITILNPLKDHLPQLLELRKANKADIASVCDVPPILVNIEPAGGLGGGGYFENQLKTFINLIHGRQLTIANRILDPLVSQGLGISDWRVRLETIKLSDPKVEAEVAKLWSEMKNITLDEIRDKIGLPPADEAMSQDGVGRVMIMGSDGVAYDLASLEKLASQIGNLPDESTAMNEATDTLAGVLTSSKNNERKKYAAAIMREVALGLREAIQKVTDKHEGVNCIE